MFSEDKKSTFSVQEKIGSMVFLENFFRSTPDQQNELEAEKKATSREVAILKSRVFVKERQNSSLRSQVTEKEKMLVEANNEIALVKEQQSQERLEAKSNEANLQKQCEELKMEKKKLEDRTTIKVKVVPTVNIKPEPEIEREVKDDNIKVNVDQRPRTLIVFGLGPLIREKDLLEEFEVFGRLEGATIVMDRKGRSKGYGFVKFLDPV